MTEVDVTAWEAAGDEYLGTKPKQWLRDPAEAWWLWKESTHNRDDRGREYRKGDDWSEVVAGRLGLALGVPVARVELARLGDRYGVISRRVLRGPTEQLVHGNELLAEVGVDRRYPRDRSGYTVDSVSSALADVGQPAGCEPPLASAFDWFTGYLVLDALIGNTDRHQDNWAATRDQDGRRRLSPSFDHASSLGFLLSDAERSERLSTRDLGRDVAAYANRARSKFVGSPSPIEAAIVALRLVSSRARSHWAGVIMQGASLDQIIDAIPPHRASDVAKRFAVALFERNLAVLSQRVRTMRV